MANTEDNQWLDVPKRLRGLYIKHAGEALDIVQGKQAESIIYTEYGPLVLYKEAAIPMLQQAIKPFGVAARALGGPNALTTALLTGALTAGAGYGTGWLAEKLFPEKYMRRGPLKRNLAITGGVLGALAGGYAHGKPLIEDYGFPEGLYTRKSVIPKDPPSDFWGDIYPKPKKAADNWLKKASEKLQVEFQEDSLYKQALTNYSGVMIPRIPKDAFNQMILHDPYTPMAIRAGTVGLTEAASQSKGGANWISPLDVGRIAVGMGSGAVSGLLVGKVLGALAGLTPEAQQGLQRGGIMAGLLTNIIPQAFGR